MNPTLKTIYNQIVESQIGERVPTRLKNGKEYNHSIIDALEQQGYVNGVDFEKFYDDCTYSQYIIKLKEIKPPIEITHDIKTDDIIYNTWGYEQTNIDFYQVISTTKKRIRIRQIASVTNVNPQIGDRGTSMPDIGNFISDSAKTKAPYFFSGAWCVNFNNGAGRLWDGKPKEYSGYA